MEAATRERRCIVTGQTGPTEARIRFVRDPNGRLTPDLAANLPGRGAWLTADRGALQTAMKKRLFARSFKAATEADPDLEAQIESLLARRCIDLIGLARRAGQAVAGFGKVDAMVRAGSVGVLLTAVEGAEDGRRRLYGLAGNAPRVGVLSAAELGLAFGRENVVHAAVAPGRLADRLLTEARRLAGFRNGHDATCGPSGWAGQPEAISVVPDQPDRGDPAEDGTETSGFAAPDSLGQMELGVGREVSEPPVPETKAARPASWPDNRARGGTVAPKVVRQ